MARPITHNDVLRARASTSTRATVDRIVKTYALADDDQRAEGADWYGDASSLVDVLADVSGMTREQTAAMIAHLSPRCSWSRNVGAAWSLVTQGHAGGGILPANARRARVAMTSTDPLATLHGPKTSAFAANILGDRTRVTVDVWATRTALGTFDKRTTEITLRRVGVYDAIQHAFRLAAARLGVDPVTVQATVWIVERGRSSADAFDVEYAAMVADYNETRERQGLATI
jgi:hypothetical protein